MNRNFPVTVCISVSVTQWIEGITRTLQSVVIAHIFVHYYIGRFIDVGQCCEVYHRKMILNSLRNSLSATRKVIFTSRRFIAISGHPRRREYTRAFDMIHSTIHWNIQTTVTYNKYTVGEFIADSSVQYEQFEIIARFSTFNETSVEHCRLTLSRSSKNECNLGE